MEKIIKKLNWRYATKQFDNSKKVDEVKIEQLCEILRLTPSSFGLQPWKFIVVTDPALREQIKANAWGQPQVVDASHLIVMCARTDINEAFIKKYIEVTAAERGVAKESMSTYEGMMLGFRKGMSDEQIIEWAKKQVYIASGFLMMAAAQTKLDTCPMEGFDSTKVDEILGLSALNLKSVLLMPVGYRSKKDKYAKAKKIRFSKEEVILRK